MQDIERDLDRYLTALRNLIRERGFTQLEVQQELGWGRSYISQLLTKQKCLRIEQVLMILHVIGMPPQEFFARLYAGRPYSAAAAAPSAQSGETLRADLNRLTEQTHGLLSLLQTRLFFTADQLADAVAAARRESR